MKQRILVVEDDPAILLGLTDLFEGEGFTVEQAVDGKQALDRYNAARPDVVLLDVMIPEKSGYDVCREIRKKDAMTPILMLTAKGTEVDKVVGLELGADDYVVKPFSVKELLARVRACLRRAEARSGEPLPPGDGRPSAPLVFGDVAIDPRTLKGRKGEEEFPVSLRELKLLELLIGHDGEAVDRFTILDRVWGIRYEGTTRTLDQHIACIRKKIEKDPSHPRFITTVHGVGYRFNAAG